MRKYLLSIVSIAVWVGAPLATFALTATGLLNNIGTYILNPIIFVLFTASLIVFLWGIVQFVAHLDDEEARQTGGKHMLWGIIGMVIMTVAATGIVPIIQNTLKSIGG